MNQGTIRWVRVQFRNLVVQSLGVVVTVVAGRLYTERQAVYSLLYSLWQYIGPPWSQS